jgi:uncharacterized protein (DUF58 family)
MTKYAISFFLWVVALWFTGVALELEVFYVLAAVLLAALLICWMLVQRAGKDLQVVRVIAHTARQGDEIKVELIITSGGKRSHKDLLFCDSIPACEEDSVPRLWISGLKKEESASVCYRIQAETRGEHQLGPVYLMCSDPFGLFRKIRKLDCPGKLLVLPRWEAISRLPYRKHLRSSMPGITRSTNEGEGQEFFGIREHRNGDGMRRVHWPSTVRARKLMVRQYESENRPDLSVFVDTCGDLYLDRATAIAMSIAMHGLDTGSRVNCFAEGGSPRHVGLGAGELQRHLICRFMSRLQESEKVTRRSLGEALAVLSGHETLIAVLQELTPETVGVLASYAYRGNPTIVLMADSQALTTTARPRAQKYIHSLSTLGVPVIPIAEEGSLDKALQAWLR